MVFRPLEEVGQIGGKLCRPSSWVFANSPQDWDMISLFNPETENYKFNSSDCIQEILVLIFQDYSTLAYAVSKRCSKIIAGNY
jgi:hypothetical protein